MDVLLVQQVTGPSVRPVVPLGLLSLATYVESASDHRVRVFDPNVHPDDWPARLQQVVRDFRPDLVGVSYRNHDSTVFLDPVNFFPALRRLVALLKGLCPHAPLVLGGAGVAVFAEDLLARLPQVDACIRGPGEEALLLLADGAPWDAVPGCLTRAGAARATRRVGFAELPFPRRDFVPMALYRGHPNAVGVLTKQGCEHQCLYCMYPHTSGRRVEVRPAEHVVEEWLYLARDFGVEHVYVADNQFNDPVASMVGLCETLLRRGVKMRWTAFFDCHRGHFDRDLLALVKRAGCVCVQATPEAFPQRSLDLFGKYGEADVRAFLALFRHEREVEALIDFFAEAPGQRLDDFLRMLAFLTGEVLGSAWRGSRVTFKLHPLRIYPKTPLHRKALREGYLDPAADLLGEGERIEEALYYLTPLRKLVYRLLLVASCVVGYRTPDYRRR